MRYSYFPRHAFILLCLFIAIASCKKNDHWPPQSPDCMCDVQRFTANFTDGPPLYWSRGYWFDKTYKPDGSIDKLYINLIAAGSPYDVIAYLKKQNNMAFLLDSASQDTVLKIELNSKGQAIRSLFHDPSSGINGPWQTYTYNGKGQVTNISGKFPFAVKYDPFGNVTSFFDETTNQPAITFTYDYSKPINGGYYFVSYTFISLIEVQLVQLLGYLPYSPLHRMKTAVQEEYPSYNRVFTNQLVNDRGYVTSFETTYFNGLNPLRATVYWHCKGEQQAYKY